MTTDPDCIFCKIVHGEIPCFKVYEDDETLAFMDINPVHPGHALVVSKSHHPTLFDMPDAAISACARTARKVAVAVRKTVEPDGINLLQCNGPAAAQSVLHFHLHVLPRKDGDRVPLNWIPRPGDMTEIGAMAQRIKGNL